MTSRVVDRSWSRSRATCGCALAACSAAIAQAPVRSGTEFQVNSYTVAEQLYGAAARDGDGDFVVVWSSKGQDGDNYGVFGRRWNAAGVAQSVEFQITSYTVAQQGRPVTGMRADGAFVVVWQSLQDGSSYGVFGRRFAAAGIAQAVEFQINTYTTNFQRVAALVVDGDGEFVVAWQSGTQDGDAYGIFARRFDAAGTPLASEFQVNTYTPGIQGFVDVAISTDGDFVVVWQSATQDASGFGVFARRFDAAGGALASEFQISTRTVSDQDNPAVAMNGGGDFVVAWSDDGRDGSGRGVFAWRFSSAGASVGVELQVNTRTAFDQRLPDVATDVDGDFVVTWESSDHQDGSGRGIFGRRWSSAGVAQGLEFLVNSYTTGEQTRPELGMDGGGSFVVTWRSEGQDGDLAGFFAQRYAGPGAVIDVDGDGVVEALTDTLLMLRYVFGFRGATLVNGAVGLNCTRCTAAEIEAYIDGLD